MVRLRFLLLFLPALLCTGFTLSHAQVDKGWTYTGKVLRADDHTPLADVSVALFTDPCTNDQTVSSATMTQKTGADGTYRFEHVGSDHVRLLLFREGFTSATTACKQFTTSDVSIDDVTLYPAFAVEQMKDDALDTAYPQWRRYLVFDSPQTSEDGGTFCFVTMDGYAHKAPEEAWSYDLKSKVLSSEPSGKNRCRGGQERDTVSPFEIDDDRTCRGCDFTLTITNREAVPGYGPSSVTLTRNESIGNIVTPDAGAIFWGEYNSKSQLILGMYETANRRKRYIVPPWTNVVTLLAARRIGPDYLLVYSVAVGCNPGMEGIVGTLREPYPDSQFAWHQPWHVCFARIPASDLK